MMFAGLISRCTRPCPCRNVSASERADIEARLNDLKTAIKDKNVDRIKKSTEELTKASHKLAEEIYKQAAAKQKEAQQQAPQDEPSSDGAPRQEKKGKEEDIIDAEYKEEDDKK